MIVLGVDYNLMVKCCRRGQCCRSERSFPPPSVMVLSCMNVSLFFSRLTYIHPPTSHRSSDPLPSSSRQSLSSLRAWKHRIHFLTEPRGLNQSAEGVCGAGAADWPARFGVGRKNHGGFQGCLSLTHSHHSRSAGGTEDGEDEEVRLAFIWSIVRSSDPDTKYVLQLPPRSWKNSIKLSVQTDESDNKTHWHQGLFRGGFYTSLTATNIKGFWLDAAFYTTAVFKGVEKSKTVK